MWGWTQAEPSFPGLTPHCPLFCINLDVLLQKPAVVLCPTKPQHITTSFFSYLRPTPAPWTCYSLSHPEPFHSCPQQSLHSLQLAFPLPAPQFLLLSLLTSVSSRLSTDLSLLIPSQPISYDVFKLFMKAYLEVDLPQPLSTHLFLAFSQKPQQETPEHPKEGASNNEASGPGTWTSIPEMEGRFCSSDPLATGSGCTPRGSLVHGNFPMGRRRERRSRNQDSCPLRKSWLTSLITPDTQNQRRGWGRGGIT